MTVLEILEFALGNMIGAITGTLLAIFIATVIWKDKG